jgi:hypothetical protein
MKTSKEATYAGLNAHFLISANKINADWLNETLQIKLDNERALYDAMKDPHRKPHVVAWMALEHTANAYIAYEVEPAAPMYASSAQLKSWLNEYGNGYDTIAPTVQYIIDERAGKHD